MDSQAKLSMEEMLDKIKGCIYGAALGDAFGLATEFMTKEQAKHFYGVGPIKFGKDSGFEFFRDRHRSRWHENDFTDDTDQMLVILHSVLETNGILSAPHFAFRLKEWSEKGLPEIRKLPCGIGFTVGSTFSHPKFNTHPHQASYDIWDSNDRNLAANGAVMRTAVLGIPFFDNEETVVTNAINAAKVTHADPRSVASAVIVSVLVSRMLCGCESGIEKSDSVAKMRKKYEQLLLHGVKHGDADSGSDNDDEAVAVDVKPLPKDAVRPQQNFFKKLKTLFRKNDPVVEMSEFDIPSYDPPTMERSSNPVPIPDTLPPSMDTFGSDDNMTHLCHQVVSDYKFLLQDNSLCSQKETSPENENENSWITELHAYCFPDSLAALDLCERKAIGYTLKCLGAGIYSCTRAIPKNISKSEFFKLLITELTLEAGDADTNCAVAGALLGCRLGFSNLPKSWLEGLRQKAYLDKLTDQLCAFVLENLSHT